MGRRRPAPGARLAALALLGALGTVTSSCGDAFSTHLPAEKAVAAMVLLPDNARVGDTLDLQVVVYTPNALNYVTRYDFGDDVDVLYFDTGGGLGCEDVDASELEAPAEGYLFPLCLTVATHEDAALGEREVVLEVESDGTAVVGRASFWLLPAYPY